MTKRILAVLITFFALVSCAKEEELPKLQYAPDGTFRIVQITDLHLKEAPYYYMIANSLIMDKPDLVVFTGDMVFDAPADSLLLLALEPVVKLGCKFALTFGNHDHEFGVSNEELYDLARKVPGCVMPARGEGDSGLDYSVPIWSKDGSKIESVLYMIDSHDYSRIEGVDGYGVIEKVQIKKYEKTSARYTRQNHGKPLPSLAFFHIPLPEFDSAWEDENTFHIGQKQEEVCCPEVNTGMFDAFKKRGDVMGVFCGHDHDNDYAVSKDGIVLAYGRFSGANTVYNHLPKGSRGICLFEGQRKFSSWLRDQKGIFDQFYYTDGVAE